MKKIAKILFNLFLTSLIYSINFFAVASVKDVTFSGITDSDVASATNCDCTGQVLLNGSFESSKKVGNRVVPANWQYSGDFTRTTEYRVCGSYSALLTGSGYFQQDTENVVPGSQVTLNIWGGYHSYQMQTFFLKFLGANDTELLVIPQKLNKSVSQNGGKLTQYTLTGIAPEGTLKVRIGGSSAGNYLKVDNACLSIEKPVISCDDCGDNKLENPSFENTVNVGNQQVPEFWVGQNFVKDAGYIVCGSKNGLINSGGGSFYQDVSVMSGSTVSLKIWGGYHVRKGHKFELIFFSGTDGEPISSVSVDLDKSVEDLNGKLKLYKLETIAPSGSSYVRVKGSSNGDYFKVDAACLRIEGGHLPVKLSSFKAVASEGAVRLGWETATEVSSGTFEIQHSTSGKKWQTIEEVAAKGESSILTSYHFTHTNPVSGNNVYRLKMIDLDGTYTYSHIVSVNHVGSSGIAVYPNPAIDQVTVQVPQNGVYAVKVYDAKGVVVKSMEVNQLKSVDLSGFQAGSYFFRMYNSNGTVASKRIEVKK